ncbi:MAG: ABC transporter ATP-binding protein [Xanthobacteraceae bacterium]
MILLELQGISRRFGQVTALENVTLSVPAESRTAIVGPSGSGKTTLLRIIAGFDAADAGKVVLGGQVLTAGTAAVPAHRRGIGYVAQDGALFPHLSIADNIGFGLARRAAGRDARIAELVRMVDLDPIVLQRRPDELSGGQQQRVALARALARRPSLMLLDEPFSALDTGLRASTRKAVADVLSAARITTILVTHDQKEALSFADQVAVIGNGRLLQVGTSRDLYLHPRSPMVAEFIGEAIILPARLGQGFADCALGRIPVADRRRQGAAQIMLRPEQVMLSSLPPNEDKAGVSADDCLGEVVAVDFGGAVSAVMVRLLNTAQDTDPDDAPLRLLAPSLQTLQPGAIVRITVSGEGHVFADDEKARA